MLTPDEIAELSARLRGEHPTITAIREAVAACKPAKVPAKSRAKWTTDGQRTIAQLRGRVNAARKKVAEAEALIAAANASPKHSVLRFEACTAEAMLPSYRARLADSQARLDHLETGEAARSQAHP